MNNKFIEWLLKEMNNRELTQADLARASGVTNAQISRIINGDRKPGIETLLAIATAFKIDPEEVLQKAGILSKISLQELDPIRRALLRLAEGLPDSDVEIALQILENRADFYTKNPQAKPSK